MQNEKWRKMFEPESKRWKRRVDAFSYWFFGAGMSVAFLLLWNEGFQQSPFPMFYSFGMLNVLCGIAFGVMVLKENFLTRWQVGVMQISWGIGMCVLILAIFGIKVE
jgi:hypothetical protein